MMHLIENDFNAFNWNVDEWMEIELNKMLHNRPFREVFEDEHLDNCPFSHF